MLRKNNLFLARLPGILPTPSENYRRYNFQVFKKYFRKLTEKFRKFPELLNFRKIYNPAHRPKVDKT